MFLLSLTNNEIVNFSKNEKFHKKIGSIHFTVFYDKSLIKIIEKSKKIIIKEKISERKGIIEKNLSMNAQYTESDKSVEIFRSPFTGKPIYYHFNDKGEFFCSNLIKWLKKTGVKINENKNVLPELFVYRIVIPPLTLFSSIKQLNIGETLKLNIKNGKCIKKKLDHFNFEKTNRYKSTMNDISNEIIRILKRDLDLIISEPNDVGMILSGGIDSSILTKLSIDTFGIKESYSTGYPFEKDECNFEKKYAITAAEYFGLNHTYYESSTKEYLESVIEGIYHAEKPLHHLQSVCLYNLYKKGIPNNKKIVIEGWGAGGLFGNFRNYLYYQNKFPFNFLNNQVILKGAKKVSKFMGKGEKTLDLIAKSKSDINLKNIANPLWSSHEYGNSEWTSQYFNIRKDDIIKNQYQAIKKYRNYSIYDITAFYSLFGDEDVTLSVLSTLSCSNNKFHFFPFYDFKLLSLAFNLSWKEKLKMPENRLRKILGKKVGVPKFILNRPKKGLGLNPNYWGVKDGAFEPLVPIANKIFDIKTIRGVQNKDYKKAMTYWNILNYSIWKRLFILDEPKELLLEELHENI